MMAAVRILARVGWLPALAVFWAWAPSPVTAEPEEVDRIVAIIGGEIILLSELDEEVYLASLREELDLGDTESVSKYRREVLDALVDAKLLLEEARRQGLRAAREDVDRAVDSMVDDVRRRFPTEAEFEEQMKLEGSSVEDLRENYRPRIEDQMLVRQLVDRTVRSRVTVAERDARTYWDEHRADIPPVPALLHLRRILVSLSGTSAADSSAVERARIVRMRVEDGEDFATLARVFSEGPSASGGGELGWFRADDLEPVLGDAVRGADAGTVTPVLVTNRGAHIIRVSDVRDDGAQRLSQIVFLRDEEAARSGARARAESIRRRLLEGENFAGLAEAESDDAVTAPRGGDLGEVPIEALDPAYRASLQTLEPGGLSEIIEAEDAFVIFRLEERKGERDATFEEVRDRIVALLEQEEGKVFYDELLSAAREATYVEVRLDSDS